MTQAAIRRRGHPGWRTPGDEQVVNLPLTVNNLSLEKRSPLGLDDPAGVFEQRGRVAIEPGLATRTSSTCAAVHILLSSGTVFAVLSEQVPGPGPAAALLRY